MKSIIKALLVVLSTVLVFTASMMGTAAYFTAGASSQNIRFSVGQVSISLNTPYALAHNIVPDDPIPIEPIVTLNQGSVDSYVRLLVTLNQIDTMDAIYGTGEGTENKLDLTSLLNDPGSGWECTGSQDNTESTRTYEFRYSGAVSVASGAAFTLPAPFKSITFPGAPLMASALTEDGKQDLFADFTITIKAEAVQAAGKKADEAWSAYRP